MRSRRLLPPSSSFPLSSNTDRRQTLDDFTANPDVVEEFFYLVGRFADYCPDPLVSRWVGIWLPYDMARKITHTLE